jgi:hypothetical protein
MKLADIEIPADVARRFVQDMLAYFAEPEMGHREYFWGRPRSAGCRSS